MPVYICETCEKEFVRPPSAKGKYCSRACYKPTGMQSTFTPEQEKQFCDLYLNPDEKGLYRGVDLIGRETGVNRDTLVKILKRNGVKFRPKSFYSSNQPSPKLTHVPPPGEQPPLCKCGCGQSVLWLRKENRWAKYVKGHYTQSAKQNPRWSGGLVTYVCKQCGKSFEDSPGQPRSYCSIECQGKAKRNPNYDDGARWHKWHATRTRIRKRDNWTCQDCGYYGKGIKRAIHVHHLDSNPMNNADDNLICLCAKCHLARHGCTLPDDWEYDGVNFSQLT